MSLASATDVPQPSEPSESVVPSCSSLMLPTLECKFEKGLQRILREQRHVSSCNRAREQEEDTQLENCSEELLKDQRWLAQDSKREIGVSQDLFCNVFPEGTRERSAETSPCHVVTFSPPLVDLVSAPGPLALAEVCGLTRSHFLFIRYFDLIYPLAMFM